MRIGALLRIEVERAFKSRMFWLMLLFGIVITGIEFVIAPLRYSKDIIGTFDGSIGNTINTVFNSWFFSLQKNAIPLRQLYIIIYKKYFFIVKCLVSHIAGLIVVVVPLLMNLIACSIILPSVKMQAVVGFYEPRGFSLLSGVAYTHPYIYIFIELMIIFLYTGLFTTFSVMLSQIVPVYFITMIFPFLLNYFCYIIQGFFNLEKYNPIRIMTVGYSYNNTLLNLIIEHIIICGITFAVYMYRGMHNEVL